MALAKGEGSAMYLNGTDGTYWASRCRERWGYVE